MRHGRSYPLWVGEPVDGGPYRRRLSYVLFRADGGSAEIMGARCPEPERFPIGCPLTDRLRVDEDALEFLFSYGEPSLMFIRSDLGVGVLDTRYSRACGIGIYWHIHGDPEGLTRLINHGVLGGENEYGISRSVKGGSGRVRAQDVALYNVLVDSWRVLGGTPPLWVPQSENGWVYRGELNRALEKIAIFVGCPVTWEEGDSFEGQGRCPRPQWLEVCLLYLLTEAKTFSADGQLICRAGTLGNLDGEGLSLRFRYSVEDPRAYHEATEGIHRYFEQVGELYGMDFHAETVLPGRGERQKGILPEVRVHLDWLRDPTVLPTSDIKAEVKRTRMIH